MRAHQCGIYSTAVALHTIAMSDHMGRAFVMAAFSSGAMQDIAPMLYYREPETQAPMPEQTPTPVPTHGPAPPEEAVAHAVAPPVGVVETVARRAMSDPCAVCLSPIAAGERMGSMRACLGNGFIHAFHARCIGPWIGIHASCPTCRAPASNE